MLRKTSQIFRSLEKILASLKFAVVIITFFAIALVVGTFIESFNGTIYAQKVIYKSWWFMGLQGLMFLSILSATLVRLPLRKALYGFYTIHAGLIILFIGSFITYVNGVDGQLELVPGRPSNRIILPQDVLKIHYVREGKSTLVELPTSAFPSEMNFKYKDVTILKYIPTADNETIWKKSELDQETTDHSGVYRIYNENFGQEFTLALNPNSDFESMTKLGPLNIHYMPENLYKCFIRPSENGFVIWHLTTNDCFIPEDKGLTTQKTSTGNEFIAFKNESGQWLKFFPDFSPMPLNDDLTKQEDANYRIFSRRLFQDKPTLFIFGKKIAYFKKRKKAWVGDEFKTGDETIDLPWMGFKLKLVRHADHEYPLLEPVYTKPIQDNGNIIHGNVKAVLVKMGQDTYWVKTDQPLVLRAQEEEVRFQLIQKELLLPYEINLDNFKMAKDPGTNNPASYESFVTVFDGRNPELGANSHHVYMNNPLKYDGFTFYQASYYPVGEDAYASVFSVNFDPGRPLKYLGSFLLVFGAIWHYMIRRKKGTKFFSRQVKQKVIPGENNA